jgi:hypothetical protein
MNYDLNTKEGMSNAVKWTAAMFDTIKDGGTWMVPRSLTMVYIINKQEKMAAIIAGPIPDPSLRRVIEAMGWTVVVK